MRVLLIVGHGGIYAGGAHQALYALQGLKNAGVEVGAIWGEDAESDRGGFKRLKDLDIPYWIIPVHRKPTIRSFFAVRRVLKQFRPDVVEAIKSGAQYHILLSGLFMRFGLVFYRGISKPMEWGQALKYRLPRVNRVIANCTDLKNIMASTGRINPDKIDVVNGEFDPSCGNPDKVDCRGLREELGIPRDLPLITQLGNHSDWRGQDKMLEAASILVRNGANFHLLFAGRETEKLLPIVKKFNLEKHVTLSKYRRDPERILKDTFVLVNASTGNESLPGSVLNGQAMGVPTVCTSLAGVSDALIDGQSGFIIPPGDAKAIAGAVGTILAMSNNEYLRMRRAARNHALANFSSEQRAKKRLETYSKCL